MRLFSNVLLASLMVFAISCGKDSKKKGGSDPYYSSYNPYVTYNPYVSGQQPTATGSAVKTTLQNYINAQDSNQSIYGIIRVSKTKYSCGDLFGISFIKTCSNKSAPTEDVTVVLGRTRGENHPILTTLLSTPSGYSGTNYVQYGNVIYVQHLNGSYSLEYAVDLNRHSAVNPVQMKDTYNQKLEYVTGPSI